MSRVILLLLFTALFFNQSSAQLDHAGRGIYVDKFFRTAKNTSGVVAVNPVFSILGVPAKEDSLLRFAKDNHITYLILYDLYYVFGNPTFEGYLCSFIQKAKTQYCIEKIGVASSCASLFDNIFTMAATDAIIVDDLSGSKKSISPERQLFNSLIETRYSPGDSLFYLSEVSKLVVRAAAYNDNCQYKIDVMVSEYEFWNPTVDDCQGDLPTKDQKYVRFQTLVNNMDIVRDDYNTSHTGHQIYVETYLGYLNQNTIYTHQMIADWIDGSYNGKRRVDRINNHYYGSDPAKLYSRTTAGQNNSGYYATRFLDFSQSTNNNQSYIHPIFSAENTQWGAGASYLGAWFSQNVNNNIFTAEKSYYNDWYDDAHNYHQTTIGSSALGTVIQPGGSVWFTLGQMIKHIDRPILFTSNSPACVATGQNGSLSFNYQGPMEQGVSFKFYITNAGNNTLRCGSLNSIPWPAYDPIAKTSIDLNAALNNCYLPVGDYDAHLELTYASGCTAYLAPIVRVSVVNTASIVALTPTTVCQGNPVYLQASSTVAGTTTYSWYDGTTAISGATNSTYAPPSSSTGSHSYSCLVTSSVTGCSANRSNVIPVTINTYPAASITTLSSSSCSVTLQANPTGGTYMWHDGSTGPTYTTSITGTYSVQVTKNGCSSNSSNYTVSSINGSGTVAPALTIASSTGNVICVGQNAVFTATPSNGGTAPVYQWKKNGINVGTNSNTYSNNSLGNNDVITCVMTSNLTCASPLTATSTGVTITVSGIVNPSVNIAASTGSTICTGTNVTFTATPANGGASPIYQWTKNGVNVGSNSNVYSDNLLANSDVINCVMTSNASCPSIANVTSTNINMTVNPFVAPTVSLLASPGNTVCSGTNVSFTATPVNGGTTPTYQWKKNGSNVGTNSISYSTGSLSNNDIISCVVTSNQMCVSPTTATNNVTMTVTTSVVPAVTISSNPGNTICSGTNIAFTAIPVNGGLAPSYQWKRNGTNVGANSNTYSNNSLNNNEVITCTMTSNATCASSAQAISSNATIIVTPSATASVALNASTGNGICPGTNVVFTATPVNGGLLPVYQWKKNGTNVGLNTSTYSNSSLANNDVISCLMTTNATCTQPLTSNADITMNVMPQLPPSVSVSTNTGNTICQGTDVTFTAVPVNGGGSPDYQWKKNGVNVGINYSEYYDNSLLDNDVITCVITSNLQCASPATGNSNSVIMSVNSSIIPSVTVNANINSPVCEGTMLTFTASPVNGGGNPSYQWKRNGIAVGNNGNVYSDNTLANNDIITCEMTSSETCSVNPAVSTNFDVHINPCVQLSMKLFIQGYYRGGNKMIAVVDPVHYPSLCDTIAVELRESTPPYNILFYNKDIIDINGIGNFIFPAGIINQNYFIVIHHRNSLETWSNNPVAFNSANVSYDFTVAANKAYGTNQADLGDGNFALWSGDITNGNTFGVQDGVINNLDRLEFENSLQQFITGYVVGDLTGDGIVESADYSLMENNYVLSVSVSRP